MLSRSKGPLGRRNGGYAKILPVEDAKVSLGETASKARDTTRGAAQGRPSDLSTGSQPLELFLRKELPGGYKCSPSEGNLGQPWCLALRGCER